MGSKINSPLYAFYGCTHLTSLHHLYVSCSINTYVIDELTAPQHSIIIICALWQALVNAISGVWTVELSNLWLQPQALTHDPGMVTARPGCRSFGAGRWGTHTRTQPKEHNRKNGSMVNLTLLLLNAVCMSTRMWQLGVSQMGAIYG